LPVVLTAAMCVNFVNTLFRTGHWNSPAMKSNGNRNQLSMTTEIG